MAKQYVEKKTPIAFVDGGNTFDIPNHSGITSSTQALNKLDARYALPTGIITMWSGTIATIPSGWALCNGSNGTPDLRNRFIVCADADSGGAAKSTITGSAAQTGGNTSHSHAGETDPESQISGACSTGVAVEPAPAAHTHVFVTDTKTHIPSFYALAYIMKL